jgi:phosphoglycolate phosphatase
MRAAIRNFIFDLDGTLVDSLPGIEESVRFAISGPVPSLRPLIGPPIRSILQTLRPEATASELDDLTRRFRASYDSGGWRRTVPQSGAAPLLADLRRFGLHAYLATNKPAEATTKILGLLAMAPYFDGVVTRDSSAPPFASKAEMLHALVRRHGLDPSLCLMVGDTAEDYTAALEAGMDVFIVANGYGSLSDVPARCRLDGLNSLLARCASATRGEIQ